MTSLSAPQHVILSAACQHPDRLVLPLPDHLKGGAATKVVGSLVAKGLVEEVEAKGGEPIWRQTGDGHGITLVATDAAFAALGVEAEPAASAPAPKHKTREGSKQALLIEMLKRPEGASTGQIAESTGWRKNTIRGAISGALKKKLGLTITAERVRMVGPNHEGATGSYTIYRIAGSEPSP